MTHKVEIQEKLKIEIELIENALAKQPYPWKNIDKAVMRVALLKHRLSIYEKHMTDFIKSPKLLEGASALAKQLDYEYREKGIVKSKSDLAYEVSDMLVKPRIEKFEKTYADQWAKDDAELGIFIA